MMLSIIVTPSTSSAFSAGRAGADNPKSPDLGGRGGADGGKRAHYGVKSPRARLKTIILQSTRNSSIALLT